MAGSKGSSTLSGSAFEEARDGGFPENGSPRDNLLITLLIRFAPLLLAIVVVAAAFAAFTGAYGGVPPWWSFPLAFGIGFTILSLWLLREVRSYPREVVASRDGFEIRYRWGAVWGEWRRWIPISADFYPGLGVYFRYDASDNPGRVSVRAIPDSSDFIYNRIFRMTRVQADHLFSNPVLRQASSIPAEFSGAPSPIV